jgi:hypothetical protein
MKEWLTQKLLRVQPTPKAIDKYTLCIPHHYSPYPKSLPGTASTLNIIFSRQRNVKCVSQTIQFVSCFMIASLRDVWIVDHCSVSMQGVERSSSTLPTPSIGFVGNRMLNFFSCFLIRLFSPRPLTNWLFAAPSNSSGVKKRHMIHCCSRLVWPSRPRLMRRRLFSPLSMQSRWLAHSRRTSYGATRFGSQLCVTVSVIIQPLHCDMSLRISTTISASSSHWPNSPLLLI